jgi:hypothetical protein
LTNFFIFFIMVTTLTSPIRNVSEINTYEFLRGAGILAPEVIEFSRKEIASNLKLTTAVVTQIINQIVQITA